MGCCAKKVDLRPEISLLDLLKAALSAVAAEQNHERDEASNAEGKLTKAFDAPSYERSDYQEQQYIKDATQHANFVVSMILDILVLRVIRSDLDKIRDNIDHLDSQRNREKMTLRLSNINWCLSIVDIAALNTFAARA